MPYAELHCRSYFSFLDAASAPEELVERAHELGYDALALTDLDGVYGAPRAHLRARALGLHLILGAEVTLADTDAAARRGEAAGRVVLLALDGKGWARLCRILTGARLRHEKGRACAAWEDLAADPRGLALLTGGVDGPADRALAVDDEATAAAWLGRFAEAFGDRAYVELTHHLRAGDDERLAATARLARAARLPRVVTQDARYATADRRVVHDVLTCIRLGVPLAAAGRRLEANGDRHLRPPRELERRFAGFADALERTAEIAARARFSLDELRYRFPAFPVPAGETPFSYLHDLVHRGARERYRPLTARVAAQLAHELGIIERLGLAGYFLIVWDIVRFCREQGILCQGRGSAANSAVCYALGITNVDPVGMDLLFERFLSEERAETPDIDLDIAHQRREDVIQYVYRRYGRERVAMANEVITYHGRSAVRDVGKVFGLSLAQVDAAAKSLDRLVSDGRVERPAGPPARLAGLDLSDRTVAQVLSLTRAIAGFPRHLGIHSGGMVITEGPIGEVVPVENATMEGRTVTQWDKDDLAQLGIIKIDLLGLGMLTVLDRALRLLERHHGRALDLAHIPPDDKAVYDMISRADTVGVFQIESRAQMSFLPRHKPRTFYDLVIEVAIIRPGPIQGAMIHPYLRRRLGQEPVAYAHPSLEPVLRRTLGVPLFQEQGMKLAITTAGFSPGEADELRRAMGHKRSHERMAALRQRLLDGMTKNGIPRETGQRIYDQLSAFADYGFPESHAASFALIVYASAYVKRHYPEVFLAALLDAQPMGFYAPQTLVADARRHGVTVLPPCALRSEWATTLEPDPQAEGRWAVRLGLQALRGVADGHKAAFLAARARGPFRSIGDFARRSGFPRAALERLAAAGGFACFGLSRREALWQVAALPSGVLTDPPEAGACDTPAGATAPSAPSPPTEGRGDAVPATGQTSARRRVSRPSAPLLIDAEVLVASGPAGARLPAMTTREELAADFVGLGLSIDKHPAALVRRTLDAQGVVRAVDLARVRPGATVSVAGMVITRQRPPTAKGMVFITLEDESGLCNLVLTPQVYERLRPLARDEFLLVAHGRLEREGLVINVRVEDLARLPETEAPGFRPRSFQ